VLGDLRVAQGRLREAESHYKRGLQLAEESPHAALAEVDELHCGLSELYREWNDLDASTRHLDAVSRAEGVAYDFKKYRWATAMARISEVRRDFDRALKWLDEAERHVRRDPMPRVQPIPALRARIHLAQGRVREAAEWATTARLTVDDAPSFAREYEHLTFTRVLLAQGRTADASRLLERLHAAAVTGGRAGSVIEILALQAIAHHAAGSQRASMDALAQALSLAEPERYLRVFLDEGPRLRDLLKTATARGLAGAYATRVLAAFDAPIPRATPVSGPTDGAPVQALTSRELEILRLIASGMRNQQIADELSITTATVKRHIANVFGKLGAGHRTEALARAKELNLL
jgi:LuxR family maltose regulon positive regulatory protein